MRRNWLIALIIGFPLGIAALANMGLLPQSIRQLYDFPYGDKTGHFLLMGTVNFLLCWTMLAARPRPERGSVILKVSLVFALIITIEEFSQKFFTRRTFSLLDLAFSYLGILVAALLAWRLKRQTCSTNSDNSY